MNREKFVKNSHPDCLFRTGGRDESVNSDAIFIDPDFWIDEIENADADFHQSRSWISFSERGLASLPSSASSSSSESRDPSSGRPY